MSCIGNVLWEEKKTNRILSSSKIIPKPRLKANLLFLLLTESPFDGKLLSLALLSPFIFSLLSFPFLLLLFLLPLLAPLVFPLVWEGKLRKNIFRILPYAPLGDSLWKREKVRKKLFLLILALVACSYSSFTCILFTDSEETSEWQIIYL